MCWGLKQAACSWRGLLCSSLCTDSLCRGLLVLGLGTCSVSAQGAAPAMLCLSAMSISAASLLCRALNSLPFIFKRLGILAGMTWFGLSMGSAQQDSLGKQRRDFLLRKVSLLCLREPCWMKGREWERFRSCNLLVSSSQGAQKNSRRWICFTLQRIQVTLKHTATPTPGWQVQSLITL